MNNQIILDQLIANIVDTLNISREKALKLLLFQIEDDTINKLSVQDETFLQCMSQIDKLNKLLSKPENILGSEFTKHGEIAELIEVYIKNANDIKGSEHMIKKIAWKALLVKAFSNVAYHPIIIGFGSHHCLI